MNHQLHGQLQFSNFLSFSTNFLELISSEDALQNQLSLLLIFISIYPSIWSFTNLIHHVWDLQLFLHTLECSLSKRLGGTLNSMTFESVLSLLSPLLSLIEKFVPFQTGDLLGPYVVCHSPTHLSVLFPSPEEVENRENFHLYTFFSVIVVVDLLRPNSIPSAPHQPEEQFNRNKWRF